MKTIILLSTSLLAAQDLPSVSPELLAAVRNYAACIESKMIELDPSNADIDDIFEAAKTECAGVWVESFFVMRSDFENRPPAQSGQLPDSMSTEWLDDIASQSRDRARVAILRRRAGLPPIDTSRL